MSGTAAHATTESGSEPDPATDAGERAVGTDVVAREAGNAGVDRVARPGNGAPAGCAADQADP
jgi:hypothetical protein